MAQYATLKAAIDAVIKANGQKEITGTVLNEVLTSMVNSLGANYQFAGVATPSTNPGTPDQNVFYLAFEAGTYTNFNATVLSAGISILKWNGSWSSQTFYTIDATPTASSSNLISSGAIFDAIKTDGSAYDVSAHFPTGGPNSDGKFTLEYILSNANTFIPAAWRKGGMSIRFVSSSDNKYVQCRYMGTSTVNADFTNVANWQGVDIEILSSSDNLAPSKLIWKQNFDSRNPLDVELGINKPFTFIGRGIYQEARLLFSGKVRGSKVYFNLKEVVVSEVVSSDIPRYYLWFFDESGTRIGNYQLSVSTTSCNIPSGADTFRLYLFLAVIGNSINGATYTAEASCWLDESYKTKCTLEEEPSSLGNSKISASSVVDFPYSAFNLHRKESYTPDASLVSNAYISMSGNVITASRMRLIKPIQLNAGEIFIIKCSGQNNSNVAIISECSATGGNLVPIFEGRASVQTYVYYAAKACYIAVSYWDDATCLMWKVPVCSISSISRYITEIAGSIENVAYYANAAYRGNIVTKSLVGDGTVQQAITIAAGDFEHDSTYIKVQGTISVSETYTNAPALYVRQFDANGTRLYNNSVNSDGSIIMINKSSGAVRYQVLMFATVTGSSIVGATYTANVKVWQQKDSYEEFIQLKTQVDSLGVDNMNIEQRLFGLTDKESLNPEHTTNGTYIRWPDGEISGATSNPMRITVPIALEQGQIIVLYASTLNDSVSAITLCDANGENRIPVVRGKFAKDYFIYFATSDCYVRLCYYTDDIAIYRINKGALKEIIDNLIEPLNPTGYNIGVDGDSITEGGQWAYYACNILKSNLYNVAVGSSCWSYKQRNNIAGTGLISPQSYSDQNFAGFGGASDLSTDEKIQKWVNNNACTHIEKFMSLVDAGTYPEPDIFVFAMGTNGDTGNGNREGTVDEAMSPADISDANFVADGKSLKYSMCGAMRWCIQTIKEAYPNCRVYVSLPIQIANYNTNKTYLYPKIQLIREMAVQMGCQIIDQYNGCGITAAIELDASPYGPYLRDGLHPNANGQQLMGKYAAKVIQSTMF